MAKASIRRDVAFGKFVSDVRSLKSTGSKLQKEFIDIVSHATIQILRDNTPVDQGELRDSWKEFDRGFKYIVVGTDLHDKFLQVVNGTKAKVIRAKNGKAMHFFIGGEEFFRTEVKHPGVVANPFINPVIEGLDILLDSLILSLVKKHWRVFKEISAPKITKFNASKTVGLTGTKVNKRRGRGGGIQKPKTGQKRLRRTLSRRRRTGKFITSKNVSVG